jgi:hypothetical protein
MKWQDCKPGDVVYHRLYTHWGPGEVIAVVPANGLELMFEKRGGRYRVVVKFPEHETLTRCWPVVLRRTPNRKRIRGKP